MTKTPPSRTRKSSGITDDAVRTRTGKDWAEWFGELDGAGAHKLDHKSIVAYLKKNHDLSGWWQQMVTVAYEQDRGTRDKHEKVDGYQISRSKTIGVPLDKLYKAWSTARTRKRWLNEAITVRKATANKSMRITWSDGASTVAVNFHARGNGKSQVALNHGKLKTAGQAEYMKSYWGERLEALRKILTA